MSFSKHIVAICGAKRSGKDVVADYMVQKYNYEKVKLAEPLKQVVNTLFDFTQDQTGETDEKDQIDERWNITPRQALQFFGTEVMQYKIQELLPEVGRNFWINSLVNRLHPNKNYVVSDLRFYHEYEQLVKHGALIIRIDRPSLVSTDTHASEEEYKTIPYDILLPNTGDIHDLLVKLDDSLAGK